MYFIHVFTTMQASAISRVVFIKTAKKTSMKHEFTNIKQEIKRMLWAHNAERTADTYNYCTDSDEDQNPF